MHERMLEHTPLCDKTVRWSLRVHLSSCAGSGVRLKARRNARCALPSRALLLLRRARSANDCSILATIVARGVMSAPLTIFASSQCGRSGLDGKL